MSDRDIKLHSPQLFGQQILSTTAHRQKSSLTFFVNIYRGSYAVNNHFFSDKQYQETHLFEEGSRIFETSLATNHFKMINQLIQFLKIIIAVQAITIMNNLLAEPIKIGFMPNKEEIIKNTEPLLKYNRPISHISNTCLTKTISNASVLAEKIPKAIQQRQFFKSFAARPFFTKNRKMMESNQKRSKNQSSYGDKYQKLNGQMGQILKTKSTVIKQAKLKQFYINKQGRKYENQMMHDEHETFKSNLFKPNLPKRKVKVRRNSIYITSKPSQSIEVPTDNSKIQRKTINFTDVSPFDTEYPLKEKDEAFNSMLNKIATKNHIGKNSNFLPKYQGSHKVSRKQKQNIEFELQPWQYNQADEAYF